MERSLISSGSEFESDYGYARAVVTDGWVHVSGNTGFDYETMLISNDVRTQCRQCFLNIKAALAEAGATLSDVIRVRYIVTKPDLFVLCQPILKEHFDEIRPAATMMVAGLLDPRMKIEIEVTACKSR